MNNIDKTGVHCINRLNATNLTDMAILHTAVYGRVPTPGFFERKYDTAYTGISYIGFIAYNTQMLPIAFYGVIPCFIIYDGKMILAAQSADTMTHPRYRNKGLFVALATQTFELCKKVGIKLLFGFPNQNSLPGFINKLNWQMTGHMDCFIISLKTLPLQKLSIKLPVLKKLYSLYTNWILKKYSLPLSGISSSVLTEGHNGLLRNDAYLHGKTYSITHVININGANVWLKTNNGLQIGDISLGKAAFAGVISNLLSIARKLGVNQVQFHTSQHTQLYQLFAECYQASDSFPIIFKDLGAGIPTASIKFTLADIDIF